MKIYIASSWKNQHAVELLTAELRKLKHEVISFVEKAVETNKQLEFDVQAWMDSEDGYAKFKYDTNGATMSNVVIYISPSGIDAWAEVGAAWASGVPILGLHAKGEQAGLARWMVKWMRNYKELLGALQDMGK